MSTKTAQLKQSFCFRSLRLMDKDYLNTSLKSFSDSEMEEKDYCKEINFGNLKKSSSENCLIPHTEENKTNIKTPSCMIKNDKVVIKDKDEKSLNVSNKESSSILNQLNTEIEKNSIKNRSDIVPEMANPYKVLENSNIREGVNENLFGEPRCLALKKYSGDFDPFLSDNLLLFEPEFEKENVDLEEKMNRNKKQDVNTNPLIKDMFVDEEKAISCEKKSSALDREEGELSPEIHQAVSNVNEEDNLSTKMNAEFFQKINECLLDLDKKCREFYSTSTPGSAVDYLRRTLSNVDGIKRKLTFLISSKNSENEKKNKLRKIVEKYYISRSTSAKDSERNSIHRYSKSNRKISGDKSRLGTSSSSEKHKNTNGSSHDRKKDKDLDRRCDVLEKTFRENNHEKEIESNSKYSNRKGNSREDFSQEHLHKKIDVLEKLGTKKEIQRIKSLFKRQMSLITKHVVRQRETDKSHIAENYRRHHSSQKEINKNKEVHEKIDLNELKTLEDMEAFLDSLKNKTNDKILSEHFMRNERKKKLLMFTSKRDKDTSLERRFDKIIPLAPAFKSLANVKKEVKNLYSKESDLEVSSHNQENQLENSNEFIEKEDESDVISKDNLLEESHNTSKDIKDTCFKTSVHLSHAQLAKNKTSEPPKLDLENRHKRELDHDQLVENSLDLKNSKNSLSLKEKEVNSSKESCQEVKNSHSTNAIEKKETLKRKRYESKHHEPEIKGETQILKRKRTNDITSTNISIVNDINFYDENSQLKFGSTSEKVTDEASNSLIKDLFTKKIFILDDKNLAMNNEFCLKVINNELYLKKISSRHKHKRSRKKTKAQVTKKVEENLFDDQYPRENYIKEQQDLSDEKNTSLEDMENFLHELRSKKKVFDDEEKNQPTRSNTQCRESKFMAKILAKRKAKLMACVSEGANATEKEAKCLKSLERCKGDLSDSSDVESRKQKLMEKMRAEVDAIVFAEKPSAKFTGKDPLKDVKTFLNIIKKAESADDESSKQVYVSFPLKRSDVKRLKSLTSGKPSSLSEESQKFLNSVRAKMRAKKAPVSNNSSLMQKPED